MDKQSYDYGEAMDLIVETLRRNRAKTDAALRARQERVKEEIRESRKAKIIRFLTGPYRRGLNLAWKGMILATQIAAWILIPLAAVAFAHTFASSTLDIESTHGALATIAVYGVAVAAGVKTARETSKHLRAYARTW